MTNATVLLSPMLCCTRKVLIPTYYRIVNYIKADVLIVGGTSLSVYPAAGLVNYYRGDKLILINKTPTPYDNRANLIFYENIASRFSVNKQRELMFSRRRLN